MSRAAPLTLLLVTVGSAVGAGAVLAPGTRGRDAASEAAALQRAVGGLGAGSSLDLRRCEHGFDPRLGAPCRHRTTPLAGGGSFCPCHRGLLAGR